MTRSHVCYTHKSIFILYTSMTPCKEEVPQQDYIYMMTLNVMYEANLYVTNFINRI